MKTTHIQKMILSFLITLAMGVGLFITAVPLTASARSASELVTDINKYRNDNGGTLSATYSSNTVTVTGSFEKGNPTKTLELNINAGVTVIWKARFIGTSSAALISTTGAGTFVVAQGGLIQGNQGTCALHAGGDVRVEGGEVSRLDGSNSNGTYAVNVGGTNSSFTMSSGKITSTSTGVMAVANATITGGEIISSGTGLKAFNTKITGGKITTTGGQAAIEMTGDGPALLITGGTVTATNTSYGSIYAGKKANISITGGAVKATDCNEGLRTGDNSKLSVTGGTVSISYIKTGMWLGAYNYINIKGVNVTSNSSSAQTGISAGINCNGIYLTDCNISCSTGYGISFSQNSSIYLTRGTVTTNSTNANHHAIWSNGANTLVGMTDGTVKNTGPGCAISCPNGSVSTYHNTNYPQYAPPQVLATTGTAINAHTVGIMGGLVENAGTGNNATIYANSVGNIYESVIIHFGTIRNKALNNGSAVATPGFAIIMASEATDGAVLIEATGTNGKRYDTRGATGIAVEWTGSNGDMYTVGSTKDLIIYGDGATAYWVDEGHSPGAIRYLRGTNSGCTWAPNAIVNSGVIEKITVKIPVVLFPKIPLF